MRINYNFDYNWNYLIHNVCFLNFYAEKFNIPNLNYEFNS